MKNSTKILLALTGIMLIILGIMCICHPAAALLSVAWLLGLFTLLAGIFELAFTINTQAVIPNSGTRMLSAILDIIIGVIFLANTLFVTAALPFVFAAWIMVEGIVISIRSFDYKQVGFKGWWTLLLLGIAGAVLGCFGLANPIASADALVVVVGTGAILFGIAYLVAVAGIQKFQNRVDKVKDEVKNAFKNGIDEQ